MKKLIFGFLFLFVPAFLSSIQSVAESYTTIGNTTFGSNGTSYNRIGNTTFGSDGTSCNRIGNTTFCD